LPQDYSCEAFNQTHTGAPSRRDDPGRRPEAARHERDRLAKALGITAARLNEIVRGERGVTAGTALRLARYFNTSPEFWLNLQTLYDLRLAQQKTGSLIERKVQPRQAA